MALASCFRGDPANSGLSKVLGRESAVLFSPLTEGGSDPIQMRHVLAITIEVVWKKQRRALQRSTSRG